MATRQTATYGAVRRKLTRLGFARLHVPGSHVSYRHPNGAVILLPEHTDATPIDRIHQVVVDATLRQYTTFDEPLPVTGAARVTRKKKPTPPAAPSAGSPGTAGTRARS